MVIICMLEVSNLPSSGQFSSALAMVGTRVIPSGLLFLDQPQHQRRLEAADHHMLGSAHRDALRTSPAVGMEQRDGVQLHVGVLARKCSEQAQSVHVERAVRKHHPFGVPVLPLV